MACVGGLCWTRTGRCWKGNRAWAMRSINVALRDAHWSHRSDQFHYKSEWQSVSASEEGVKRHLGVLISDVTQPWTAPRPG